MIQRVAEALRANNIEVVVVDTGDEARDEVLSRVEPGSEVYSGKSLTLEEIGVFAALHEPGRFDAIRPKLQAMDRATHGREMRKLGSIARHDRRQRQRAHRGRRARRRLARPATSSAGYAAGAGRVILVVGSQKIVPDLDAALRRIREVVFPYEDARVRATLGSRRSSRRSCC